MNNLLLNLGTLKVGLCEELCDSPLTEPVDSAAIGAFLGGIWGSVFSFSDVPFVANERTLGKVINPEGGFF